MTTTLTREVRSLGEKLEELGDINPERILWFPRPGNATEEDYLACRRKMLELVDGMLIVKFSGLHDSSCAALLGYRILSHVREGNLGVVAGPTAPYRLRPGLIRLTDVGYKSWKNLPSRNAHLQEIANFVPDLAVEALSEIDRPAELKRRVEELFEAGTQLVWLVDPRKETVVVYTDPISQKLLRRSDTLDGGKVFPGFSLPLEMLFSDPMLNPRPDLHGEQECEEPRIRHEDRRGLH